MYLVLTETVDPVGPWLVEALGDQGLTPVVHVTGDQLASARDWRHWVETDAETASAESAAVGFTCRLPDGEILDTRLVRGAINRLQSLRPPHYGVVIGADADYALQEFTAFAISVLASLPGVVMNPATAGGLSGQQRHNSEWVWMAAQSGLPVLPYVLESRVDAPEWGWLPMVPANVPRISGIVVDGDIVGALPRRYHGACLDLARRGGYRLLGVDMVEDEQGRLVFGGATPWPDMRAGGVPLARALAANLARGEAGDGS